MFLNKRSCYGSEDAIFILKNSRAWVDFLFLMQMINDTHIGIVIRFIESENLWSFFSSMVWVTFSKMVSWFERIQPPNLCFCFVFLPIFHCMLSKNKWKYPGNRQVYMLKWYKILFATTIPKCKSYYISCWLLYFLLFDVGLPIIQGTPKCRV